MRVVSPRRVGRTCRILRKIPCDTKSHESWIQRRVGLGAAAARRPISGAADAPVPCLDRTPSPGSAHASLAARVAHGTRPSPRSAIAERTGNDASRLPTDVPIASSAYIGCNCPSTKKRKARYRKAKAKYRKAKSEKRFLVLRFRFLVLRFSLFAWFEAVRKGRDGGLGGVRSRAQMRGPDAACVRVTVKQDLSQVQAVP